MFDLLITNSTIIDGSGAPAFVGSVAAIKGKIKLLPADCKEEAIRHIDGTGLMVTPGFIDSHSHGDMSLGYPYASLSKLSQGITTQVAGMCGVSLYPIVQKHIPVLQQCISINKPETGFPKEMPSFTTAAAYFNYVRKLHVPENTRFLVGHGTIRCAVMGTENRKPSVAELEKMKELVRDAMEAGAGGLSTGLIYVPSVYGDVDEITELVRVVAAYGGVYATHMRNESTESAAALEEAITIARKTGVNVIISHHKLQGKRAWGLSAKTISMMEQANQDGLSVSCDQYPYTACMSALSDCCPPEYYSKGFHAIVDYLNDPVEKEKIRQKMMNPNSDYENYYLNSGGWDGIFVTDSPQLPEAARQTISAYAASKKIDPFDAYCQIMIANKGTAVGIFYTMCDEDLERIACYENTAIGTDGIIRNSHDVTHPRVMGTFPRAIRLFVKEKRLFSLEEMIRKMTSLTAYQYKLTHKGLIVDGYDADLNVIDYDKISDTSTYADPLAVSDGFPQVIVAGNVVYENKRLTGKTPGKVILFNE